MYMGKYIKPADSLIGWWRTPSFSQGATTAAAIGFFLWAQLWPCIADAKELVAKIRQAHAAQDANRDPLNDALKSAKSTLDSLDASLSGKAKSHRSTSLSDHRVALKALRNQLVDADKEVMASFTRDLDHINKYKLGEVIKQRHEDAVARYQANHKQMLTRLDAIGVAEDQSTLVREVRAAKDWLDGQQRIQKKYEKADPGNMPFRVTEDKARLPRTTAADLRAIFKAGKSQSRERGRPTNERKRAATAHELATLEGGTTLAEYRALQPLGTLGGSAGLIAFSALMPPGPEYLDTTQNEDVLVTPDIQALADQLGPSPVAIFNWVHDHVDFVPSYGVIQGADFTLQSRRGNSFDISSLLVALLRAEHIPARYVYGSIVVPADKGMNWLGGFTSPDAAQTLMGQGGVPNVGITKAGKTVAFQMEHVWVEAFVDYYPSRGAKNVSPDTWIPMDASFKQFAYQSGIDLQAHVPFDTQSFLNQATQGAAIDAQNGVFQNISQANVESAFSTYQTQIQDYISQSAPNATVKDLLGSKTVVPVGQTSLASSLPYQVTVHGAPVAALPASLHAKFRYRLYADDVARSQEDYLASVEENTVHIAGKKVSLVFVPATDADAQTIKSYLPQPHADGSPIDPSEFPQTVPAYQIQVAAKLKIDNEVVASVGSFSLAAPLLGEGGFTSMDLADWDLSTDLVTAGEASVLGVSLQGISTSQMTKLAAALQVTNDKLQNNDAATLTEDRLVQDSLTSIIWGYFSAVEAFGRVTQQKGNVVDWPGLSYGFLHELVVPINAYGVTTRARFPGLLMDIGHQRRLTFAKDNDTIRWRSYNRVRGQHASLMEAEFPQQALSTDTSRAAGFSAVSGLAIAAAAGQKIFVITPDNQSQLANVHQSDQVMEDIRNALNAGKEVTVHESPISVAGFSGAGYILTDITTGAGAYLIEGGGRGSLVGQNDSVTEWTGIAGDVFEATYKEEVFQQLSRRCVLYGLITKSILIATACPDPDQATDVIKEYVAMTVAALFLSFIFGMFLGPLGVFILSVLLNVLADKLVDRSLARRGCKTI